MQPNMMEAMCTGVTLSYGHRLEYKLMYEAMVRITHTVHIACE